MHVGLSVRKRQAYDSFVYDLTWPIQTWDYSFIWNMAHSHVTWLIHITDRRVAWSHIDTFLYRFTVQSCLNHTVPSCLAFQPWSCWIRVLFWIWLFLLCMCMCVYMHMYIYKHKYTYTYICICIHHILQGAHCHTMHHTATHFNTMQHNATHWISRTRTRSRTHPAQMSHVTHAWVTSHMDGSSHTHTHDVKYAMIWTSHVTYEWVMSHLNESCHTCMSHVTYGRVMSHESCHVWTYTYTSVSTHPDWTQISLQHTATLCNTPHDAATHCNAHIHTFPDSFSAITNNTAAHCNTLQHTTQHCNTLRHTTWRCNALQRAHTHLSRLI